MERIAAVLPLLLLLSSWKWCVNTYLSPSIIFLGTWSAFLTTHALFAPNYKFSYSAGFIIDMLIISFVIGEFTIVVASNRFRRLPKEISMRQSPLNSIVFKVRLRRIIVVLGIVSLVGSLMYFAIFINHFGSLIGLFTAGSLVRGQLAEGLISVPLYIRIIVLSAYSTLVLSLIYWIYFEFKWYLTIPFISMLLMGVAQAGRAATFMMLIIIFVAALWRDKVRCVKKIALRSFKRMIIITIIILVIFTLGMMQRTQNFNILSFNDGQMGEYKSYSYGSISAFSAFWDQYSLHSDYRFGIYSFASLSELLGISKLPAGFYSEYVLISNTGGEVSNVFTLFRSLIDDFGVVGALIYMYALGAVIALVFQCGLKGNKAAIAFILVADTMLIYSVIAPITQHNTILLSFIVPSLILSVIGNIKPRIHVQCGALGQPDPG